MTRMRERRIIHIDMDAFFASIEQRDKPELRGIPIAVGYDGPRGVVSTASYEARRYGVHSAMSISKAKRLCPDLVVVPSDFRRYKEVSSQVHEIFLKFTDVIEPISIDEAFLDVSEYSGDTRPELIAEEIRKMIRDELCLTASAGVSYNKFLAKIASDYNKPDGMYVITRDMALDFLSSLPIERFWGVGPKTAVLMRRMGIFTGGQLRRCSLSHLTEVFGKSGLVYYDFARGIDNRSVEPVRLRKSVGCEHTFKDDISNKSAVLIELYHTVIELVERLRKSGFRGHTLTLKVKFFDFTQITRSITQVHILETKASILPLAKQLMSQVDFSSRSIRLIGLSVSNPSDGCHRGEWVEGELDFKE